MADHWIPIKAGNELPFFAVQGARKSNNEVTHVGRCLFEGDLLPAGVRPRYACAFVSWSGKLYTQDEYEILLGPGYEWIPYNYEGIPYNAVSSGNCSRGEPLFIGRGYHNGYLCVGKIYPTHDCLYVPFGAGETRINKYEILVKAEVTWKAMNLQMPVPEEAVTAGEDCDGSPIYVARAGNDANDKMLPANFSAAQQKCLSIDSSRNVYEKEKFEILCGSNYIWVNPEHKDVSTNAVLTDRQLDGQPLVVGRAYYKGTWSCGLVVKNAECVIIPIGQKTIRVQEYEVLIKNRP